MNPNQMFNVPIEQTNSGSASSSSPSSVSIEEQSSPSVNISTGSIQNSVAPIPIGYSYLPTPPSTTPVFGFTSPYPASISFAAPEMTSYSQPQYVSYGYGYLPTIPPRYSGTVAAPQQPHTLTPLLTTSPPYGRVTTGCVSPLDLFGAGPPPVTNNYSPATGLGLQLEPAQAYVDTSMEVDDASIPQSGLPSPASSADSGSSDNGAEEPRVDVAPKKAKKQSIKKESDVSPVKAETEAASEGKEGKKRSRSAQACERCRIRKARCFGGHPCNRCVKRKFVCEFGPTRARLAAPSKPEASTSTATPSKTPKARRHSMASLPSNSAPLPHPLSLTQVHSHAEGSNAPTLAQSYQPSHAHTHAMGQESFLSRTVSTNFPINPSLTMNVNGNTNSLGLGGIHLNSHLSLTPPADNDEDSESSPSDDLTLPGMTSSFTGSSSSASQSIHTASASSANSVKGGGDDAWSHYLNGSDELYSPTLEDDMFSFSPLPTKNDWNSDSANAFGYSFPNSEPMISLPTSNNHDSQFFNMDWFQTSAY